MLSLPHLVVLFVLALVIFGPQKLPELARMLGKATAEFRKMSSDFRYALEDEVRELERQTRIRDEEIASAVKAAQTPPEVPATPDGAIPREVQPWDGTLQNDPREVAVRADAEAAKAVNEAAPEGVGTAEEKPADDHTPV